MLDFLNESSIQAYPFVGDSITFSSGVLPYAAVLDMDIVLGPSVPFSGDDLILTNIVASSDTISMGFTCGSVSFTFALPRSTSWGGSVWNTDNPSIFSGFIQVGNLDGIPNGSYSGEAIVEPSRVQSRYNRELRSLSVVNKIGTLYRDKCGTYPPIGNPYIVEASNLKGDITVSPGRWAEVTQLENPPQLVVGPSTTEEEGGEPACGEDLTPKPAGWPDNEPTCDEVLNTINGVSPSKDTKSFTLSGSRGVSIVPNGGNGIKIIVNTAAIFKEPPVVPPPGL